MIRQIIEDGVEKKIKGTNPNNLFAAANRAAISLANPDLKEPLIQVVEKETPANIAFGFAVEALKAINEKEKDAEVEKLIQSSEEAIRQWREGRQKLQQK